MDSSYCQHVWTFFFGPSGLLLKDMLHTVHQGVALHAIAALVTHHYEEACLGITLSQLNDKLTSDAWSHYRNWCKGKSVVCPTSSTFTALRFGRENWQSYPELASCYKGAMVKYMIFWVAEFLKEKFNEVDTENNRLRAYCAWSLYQFQYLQETNGPWLSSDVATEMAHVGRTFLFFYQKLALGSRAACPEKKCTNLSQSSIVSFTCAFSRRWHVGIPDMTTYIWKRILWNTWDGFAANAIQPR